MQFSDYLDKFVTAGVKQIFDTCRRLSELTGGPFSPDGPSAKFRAPRRESTSGLCPESLIGSANINRFERIRHYQLSSIVGIPVTARQTEMSCARISRTCPTDPSSFTKFRGVDGRILSLVSLRRGKFLTRGAKSMFPEMGFMRTQSRDLIASTASLGSRNLENI